MLRKSHELIDGQANGIVIFGSVRFSVSKMLAVCQQIRAEQIGINRVRIKLMFPEFADII